MNIKCIERLDFDQIHNFNFALYYIKTIPYLGIGCSFMGAQWIVNPSEPIIAHCSN